MHKITRRSLIETGVASLAAAILSHIGGRPATAQTNRAFRAFERKRLASREEIWAWCKKLNSFGPRLTGTEAHARSIDYLADELEKIGLQPLRDREHFTRWQAQNWGLSVDGTDIEVLSCYPYSGQTPASGVTGELIYLGQSRNYAVASGKIAIVDVPCPPLSRFFRYQLFTRKARLPDNRADIPPRMDTILLGGTIGAARVDLKSAAEAGVLAVICIWRDVSEARMRDQYLPFITPPQDCPALWIGEEQGSRVLAAAEEGRQATLTLSADILQEAPTDTLYAVLPGDEDAETIIINTHTDGPNAYEENGPAGLLAMARYFAGLPRAARRRTLVFVFVTGHFQLPQFAEQGQATTVWLERHRDLWDGSNGNRHAVAGLTLEHLGCMEWAEDDETGDYRPTGAIERELVYTTNPVMEQAYHEAVETRTKLRSLTLSPRNGIFLGEGSPLYEAGIPSICLCPIPDYLCAASPGGGLDKLDPELMYQQVESFTRALLFLDALDTESIGTTEPVQITIIGAIVKLLQRL